MKSSIFSDDWFNITPMIVEMNPCQIEKHKSKIINFINSYTSFIQMEQYWRYQT